MIKKLLTKAAKMAWYFDDLLLIASGTCFTVSAALAFGRAAAIAVAGAALGVYAFTVARARGGK